MYETFEHTADLGLRVEAPDLDTLFAEAGRGLCSMLVDDVETVHPETEVRIHIDGAEREYLLFDWLSELLYRYETDGLLLAHFEVRVTETGLAATARGEPLDPERNHPAHEVKAITYHKLVIEPTDRGLRASVIVDI